jgi:hypothetical protein
LLYKHSAKVVHYQREGEMEEPGPSALDQQADAPSLAVIVSPAEGKPVDHQDTVDPAGGEAGTSKAAALVRQNWNPSVQRKAAEHCCLLPCCVAAASAHQPGKRNDQGGFRSQIHLH